MKSIKLVGPLEKYAIVDDNQYDELIQYRWYVHKSNGGIYASRCYYETVGEKRVHRRVFMHRMIMGAKPREVVDHINGDTLFNTGNNLRICTNAENVRRRVRPNKNNTTGYRGVSKYKGGYVGQIMVNGRHVHVGVFDDPAVASQAVAIAREQHFGAFAGNK